jgi:hypothetical protein
MPIGTGNTKVPPMSVTNVGASHHPTTPPPLSGPSGERQAVKSAALNHNENSGVNKVASGATGNATRDANRLPPPQAATTPGTGQKVDMIA